jgi:hypothetical protein
MVMMSNFMCKGEVILAEGLLRNAIESMSAHVDSTSTASSSGSGGTAAPFLSSAPLSALLHHPTSASSVSAAEELVLAMHGSAQLLSKVEWNGKSRSPEAQKILEQTETLRNQHPTLQTRARAPDPTAAGNPASTAIASWYFDSCLGSV